MWCGQQISGLRFQISDFRWGRCGGGGATLHMREKVVEACRRPFHRGRQHHLSQNLVKPAEHVPRGASDAISAAPPLARSTCRSARLDAQSDWLERARRAGAAPPKAATPPFPALFTPTEPQTQPTTLQHAAAAHTKPTPIFFFGPCFHS